MTETLLDTRSISVGYFADGPWGQNAFALLNDDPSIDIRFVCVRYDTQDPMLVAAAKANGITCLFLEDVNVPEAQEMLASFDCDLFISMSFNQIFQRSTFEIPPMKTINCHAGKLPFYRGRNPLNWVLINDETEWGISVHYIDEGIDTGDLLAQRTFPISDDDTYGSLLETAYGECPALLMGVVKRIQANSVEPVPQDSIDPVGKYCCQRKQGDEILDWKQNSRAIFNFVRAIAAPGPDARSFVGNKIYRIRCAVPTDWNDMPSNGLGHNALPGAIVAKSNDALIVRCSDGYMRVTLASDYGETIESLEQGMNFSCQ